MNDPAPPLIPAVFFEDELDLKEEELLSAACRLIKKFPQLNGDHDGNITGRILGILDANVFLAACSSHKQRADESSEETRNRAQEAHVLWSNVVNASFVLVEPGEFDVPFKPYAIDALEELKDELGLLLYRHIRKGFREVRVSVKYEIQLKPWNHEEGKEANLDYLLTSLEQQLRFGENLEIGHPANNNNLLLIDRDFTGDDYELLLALDVNNHQGGLSSTAINNLPESTVQTDNLQESCVICLETQTIGDTIRHLPCLHKFHKDCVDRWLRMNKACPVCKEDAY